MNTNPNVKKIICYGDSNTWGYVPLTGKRYPANIRWTGILQNLLGDSFEIIEEGLNSRTTTVDDPLYAGKNGKTYLLPCIETHWQFDTVILFLGTNDLKERFARSPEQIAQSIQELINIILNFNAHISIILICPSIVDESVSATQKNYKGAQAKSVALPALYQKITDQNHTSFINLQSLVKPSNQDGFHFDPDAHEKIAQELAREVNKINTLYD